MTPKFVTNEWHLKGLARSLQTELQGRRERNEVLAVSKAIFYESDPNMDQKLLENGAAKFVDNLKLPDTPKLGSIQTAIAWAFADCNYQTLKAKFEENSN